MSTLYSTLIESIFNMDSSSGSSSSHAGIANDALNDHISSSDTIPQYSHSSDILSINHNINPKTKTSFFFGPPISPKVDLPRHNLQLLPTPPAAHAFQHLKIARQAFDQVRSSHAAVERATQEAAKWSAVSKQAAEMAANQSTMKDHAAAAAIAKTLGYAPDPVGVPTMNAFGEMPPSAPPYSFNYPNPPPGALY